MNVWMGFSPDRLNEDTTVKLTKVPEGVKLTVEVPESLRKEGRTYYLLACHNGTVKVVAQGTGTTLSWVTDEFATYLIAYRDASGSGSKKSSTSSTKKSSRPGTGDDSQMMLWTLLLIASASGLAVMLSKKKRGHKRI